MHKVVNICKRKIHVFNHLIVMNERSMIQCDHYDSEIHVGELPVRVLTNIILHRFENIYPDFEDDIKAEIAFNGFKVGIKYCTHRTNITECAGISPDRHIELYENFNQYLWCICYSLFVLYDKMVLNPNNYDPAIEDEHVQKAMNVFISGCSLLDAYETSQFFILPNPEKYNKDDKNYIEHTNEIYVDAMTFILLHEFAHQYYKHVEYDSNSEDSKKEEYDADEYAIDKMKPKFSLKGGGSFKFGIIAGISSLIIWDKSLSGGDKHPDNDERLKAAMNQLDLPEIHTLWGVGSLAFRLWAKKYDIEINLPPVVANHKELFDLILEEIKGN